MDPIKFLDVLLDVLKDEPPQAGLVRVWHIKKAREIIAAQAAAAPVPAPAPAAAVAP